MNKKTKISKVLTLLLTAGILFTVPAVQSEAAVITTNATDKIAVVFHENTAYSAGDYVIYNGEMYICVEDVQGIWESAKSHFMQVTKNNEIGSQEDLSASYDASVDPSEEKSLMAFTANAWQKLKSFFGMESKAEEVDVNDYKNASVSAKLNFLQKQNERLDQNVSNLQGWITQSFTSVSNGKSILVAAITDKKGTAGPTDSFSQLSQAIRDLALIQYNDGHSAGMKEGYDQGYGEGIQFADGRVNEQSASYQQGMSVLKPKLWVNEIHITKEGPDKEHECFSNTEVSSTNKISYSFLKQFEGHTILTAFVETEYSSAFSDSNSQELVALEGNDRYLHLSDAKKNSLGVSKSSISWGRATFNVLDSGATVTLKFRVAYI